MVAHPKIKKEKMFEAEGMIEERRRVRSTKQGNEECRADEKKTADRSLLLSKSKAC